MRNTGGEDVYKLVIVDDEDEIRHALSTYIPWSNMGFKFVDSFTNGRDAYNYFHKNKIDVLLCDIKMPIMNGIELAERVYNENLVSKVVFLSAHREFDYARKALTIGVEDYVLKPTKYQELFDCFQKIRHKLNQVNSNQQKREIISAEKNNNYNNKVVRKVKKYLANNYKTANLEDAAEKVHYSPAYLSKFFKDCTGENFSTYLNKIKMEKAKEYLESIEYNVYQVSEKIGYSNPKNFCRSFKRYTGRTPSQFRRGMDYEKGR